MATREELEAQLAAAQVALEQAQAAKGVGKTVQGMGFTDPLGVYPKSGTGTGYNSIKEPDSSRLARGEDAEMHASLINKRETRLEDIPVATAPDVSSVADTKPGKMYERNHWDEPNPRFSNLQKQGTKLKDTGEASYVPLGTKPSADQIKEGQSSIYPYNDVRETESGHVFEVDDTPGNGRIHEYHNSGTFYEVQADGKKITKVVGEDFEIVLKDKNLFVKGNLNINVQGDTTLYVNGDMYQEVDGDMFTSIRGDRVTKIAGNDVLEVLSNQNTQINGNRGTRISGDDSETVQGNQTHTVGGTKTTTVNGDVKEKHLANMNVTVADNFTTIVGGKYNLGVAGLYSVATKQTAKVISTGNMTLETKADQYITVASNQTIGVSGNITEDASNITSSASSTWDMNGSRINLN